MTTADETQPEKEEAFEEAATSEVDLASEAKDKAAEDRTVEDWEALLEFQRNRAENNFTGWQRAQADYANHKRRADQERTDALKYGGAPALGQMLGVADDMDRALSALPITMARMTWIEGIAIIHRKILALLEASGVEEIDAQGKEFDPNVHESIAQADGPEGQVVQVIQKGYQLYDRVLRPTLVQVGNGNVPSGDETEEEADTPEPEEPGSESTEDRE
ncbi:MAG: nucleotide exchange factor GrpE [Dehalococcoidia bacterium]|jgi:molecular chaperone GrpE|nr:nucleotide exchange factor GrpE [Dehalococcoidia bacterium]